MMMNTKYLKQLQENQIEIINVRMFKSHDLSFSAESALFPKMHATKLIFKNK